jgi:predicted nucleotidyltransferase
MTKGADDGGKRNRGVRFEGGRMRLTEAEIAIITTAIKARFGSVLRIILFGSRVDDAKRGGDIDLLVETKERGRIAFLHQTEAMSDIQFALGDRKIDMVLANPEGSEEDLIDARPVVRISRATGIAL